MSTLFGFEAKSAEMKWSFIKRTLRSNLSERTIGGKGSGASIWNWVSTTLVLPNEMIVRRVKSLLLQYEVQEKLVT